MLSDYLIISVSPFHIFEERVAMTYTGNFRPQQNTGLNFHQLFTFLSRHPKTANSFVSRSQESEIKISIKQKNTNRCNDWQFSDLIKWGSCIYILLHEPEFSTVNPLVALISKFSLHDFANLTFFHVLRDIPQIDIILSTVP